MPSVSSNGLTIEYECFGADDAPVILMIQGLATPMTGYPVALCEKIAAQGFRVIRFDNRDIGKSTKLDHLGMPRLVKMSLRSIIRLSNSGAKYLLADMALDTVGLLNALDISAAHIVGTSMGGMIAQELAGMAPERLLSLTSIMSSSGHRWLPHASAKVRRQLMSRPQGSDIESIVQHNMKTWRMIGSPAFPKTDEALRAGILANMQQGQTGPGVARQMAAILCSPSRVPILRQLTMPCLVIHGKDDALVPVKAGIHTAKSIPGAKLNLVPGMGHDFPEELFQMMTDLITGHAGRAAVPEAA